MSILTKKENSNQSLEVSDEAKKIFKTVYDSQKKQAESFDDDTPKIKVSEVISKLSFYYEKIRNAIDYQEEYLHRKNATKRILKRLVVIEGEIGSEKIARNLLMDLIRAGYLPNNKIPETKISEVSTIIAKFLKLRKEVLADLKAMPAEEKKTNKDKHSLSDFIIGLAASELDENFGRDKIKETVTASMYKNLSQTIKLPDDSPYYKDLKIQIYLAIHRDYMKFDQEMLAFILFKYFNPNWNIVGDREIKYIASYIFRLREVIEYQLNHPLVKQLDKIVIRYNVFYSVLTEAISEEPTRMYAHMKNQSPQFESEIKKVCAKKYKSLKTRLWRAAFRSIIYIFLTKSVLVFILEIPATKFFGEEINTLSLLINVAFPPALLFFIVVMTQMPGPQNTQRIIDGIKSIVYADFRDKQIHILRKAPRRSTFMNFAFSLIYFITYFISFGGVIYVLYKIDFTWVSVIIFLFFLALISFFSVRIRKNAKEYMINPQKDSFINILMDFFYFPIVSVGKWLSEKFSKFNFLIFVFDFLLEAPFKLLVGIAEEWTNYAKERKEEIY